MSQQGYARCDAACYLQGVTLGLTECYNKVTECCTKVTGCYDKVMQGATLRVTQGAGGTENYLARAGTTLEATQGQILSQSSTDATSRRLHLNGSRLKRPSICPWVVSRVDDGCKVS